MKALHFLTIALGAVLMAGCSMFTCDYTKTTAGKALSPFVEDGQFLNMVNVCNYSGSNIYAIDKKVYFRFVFRRNFQHFPSRFLRVAPQSHADTVRFR